MFEKNIFMIFFSASFFSQFDGFFFFFFANSSENFLNSWFSKIPEVQRKEFAKKKSKKSSNCEKTMPKKNPENIFFKHLPCPPQTPLLSNSHDRTSLPRYRCGSSCPWIYTIYIHTKDIKN